MSTSLLMVNNVLILRMKMFCYILFLILAVNEAWASGYARRQYPNNSMYEIGEYDDHLSYLCKVRKFSQLQDLRTAAYFGVEKATLGGAKGNGWNLYDVTRASNSNFDYWFHMDGTSQCKVFKVNKPQR